MINNINLNEFADGALQEKFKKKKKKVLRINMFFNIAKR